MSDSHSFPLQLGISACLLGERVRYDGGHKMDAYVAGTLGRFFTFVPVCPEVAIGLGVPRPPIRLEGDPEHPRIVGVRDSQLDVTEAMESFSRRQVQDLGAVSGFILKSRSPSCGVQGVTVHGPGNRRRQGAGAFARALIDAHPLLPVADELGLGDPERRDNFIECVFAYRRWQLVAAQGITRSRLVEFHTAHKLSLLAHGREAYRALGRLAADAGRQAIGPLAAEYIHGFMGALAHRATPGRHADVLQHLMGYLKTVLEPDDKAELLDAIEDYRRARVPRLMPLTLLRHHFLRHPDPYVAKQVYLYPDREELLLRSGGL